MDHRWHFTHIIDLEYFFHLDESRDRSALHRRDREFFIELKPQLADPEHPNRRELMLHWLRHRRQTEQADTDATSPGEMVWEGYRLATLLLACCGAVSGFVAGYGYFSYSGTTPINVFQFLLLFVFSQLVLVALLLASRLLRPVIATSHRPTITARLGRKLVLRAARTLGRRWQNQLSAAQRTALDQATGLLRGHSQRYGALFQWPLLALTQVFSIWLNLGLLGATLTKITTSDLAFGWQSTLALSHLAVHRLVSIIALPWSWLFGPGIGYPTPAEIEGSRIILKDGIYHLTTQDLTAWWPFLVFALLFYGLLLRICLYCFARLMGSQNLKTLRLDTPQCLALMRRMLTPLVSTQATREEQAPEVARDFSEESGPQPQSTELQPLVALIPDDIFTELTSDTLNHLLQDHHLLLHSSLRFMVDYDSDQELLESLATREWSPAEGLLIVMEGWMPPLLDFLTYLQKLRQGLDQSVIIHLALIGKLETGTVTPLAREHMEVWRQKIAGLGDPYLTLFELNDTANSS